MKFREQWKKLQESKYYVFLTVAFRFILGGIFIAASIPKLQDTMAFAEIVASYKILPIDMVLRFAQVLPIVELVFGILLVIGYKTRVATSVLIFLLIIFIIAIGLNLWRGESAVCGCFNVSEGGSELGWQTIIRDVILMVLGFHILLSSRFQYSVDAWIAKRKIS